MKIVKKISDNNITSSQVGLIQSLHQCVSNKKFYVLPRSNNDSFVSVKN